MFLYLFHILLKTLSPYNFRISPRSLTVKSLIVFPSLAIGEIGLSDDHISYSRGVKPGQKRPAWVQVFLPIKQETHLIPPA